MTNPHALYLIGPRNPKAGSSSLARFAKRVTEIKGAAVESGNVDRHLVVRLPEHALKKLRAEFESELIIEPDAPLTF